LRFVLALRVVLMIAASLMSDEAVAAVLRRWKREFQVSMFAAGVSNVAELQQAKLIK
jgi:isopentenyl diphosphate isomerase/L-lactate dehydrogenase-like FMN-dependent dehydrogenase